VILAKTIASWRFLLGNGVAQPPAAAIRSASPYPGTYSVNSFEGAVECGLITESTPNGDIGEGQARVHHKIAGSLDTAFGQPVMRWLAKGFFEGPRKVAYG
jgi:hypothetical protein